MNRMNFARFSGVIVDWCKQHGTWFEQKELTQLVHFIREGGMKRSREREKESLREEASRLRQKSFEIEAERRNSYTLSPEESDDFSQLFTALKSLIKSD
jgi:Zn-finger nucleic acid-binding protein